MDEGELVDWLQKELGRRIPAEVLRRLRKDGYLHAEDDEEREDALMKTRSLLQFDPKENARLQLPSEKTLRALAERDVQRRDAVSEYWAKEAGRQPAVRRFREEVLGGRLLTPAEAQQFLTSPAALMFGADKFRLHGVDPARHEARVVDEEGTRSGPYRAVVEFADSGATLEFRVTALSSNLRVAERPALAACADDGPVIEIRPWPFSVLHDLRTVCALLEARNKAWRKGAAAWFVVTGQRPAVVPLGHSLDFQIGSLGNRSVITLEIEPWISVERVAYLYAALQKRVLGRHNRQMSERRIALFRFITEQTNEDDELPPWRGLMDEWNRRYGAKWRYENVRNFSRDYWAAARGLIFPNYRLW